jgi:hypothetical protein
LHGKEGCGEKKRLEKVYQAKKEMQPKADEKLDAKGDKSLGSKTLSSR